MCKPWLLPFGAFMLVLGIWSRRKGMFPRWVPGWERYPTEDQKARALMTAVGGAVALTLFAWSNLP